MKFIIGIIVSIIIIGIIFGLIQLKNDAESRKDDEGKKVIGYVTVALLILYVLWEMSKNN
jgi:glucose uptake protein GlcU